MVKIIGVDFSGADEEKVGVNTWITEGHLEGGGLEIIDCHPIRRNDLTKLLKDQPNDTVAAMDFPFSVPQEFAEYWQRTNSGIPRFKSMTQIWEVAKGMKLIDFETKCKSYANLKRIGEKHPLRVGDLYSSKPMSCLNSRMAPMTFHGMQMLHWLWKSGCRVPPLNGVGHKKATLLEVMPGAALKSFGLPAGQPPPDEDYKKGKDHPVILANRRKILAKLADCSKVPLPNLAKFRDEYIYSDDALDSLVAATVAAQWAAKRHFHCPSCNPTTITSIDNKRAARASMDALAMPQVKAARLEGWIYVPMPL